MAKTNKASLSFGGQTITLTKSTDQVAVKLNPGATLSKKDAKNAGGQLESFTLVNAARGLETKLDALRKSAKVAVGTHVYHVGENNTPFVPTGKIYIEFAVDAGADAKRALLEKLHLRVSRMDTEDIYQTATTSLSPNPIKACAELQKSKIVRIAEPELATFPQTNDFLMPVGRFIKSQWHHKNTGDQVPIIDIDNAVFGKHHFKKGADARVADAWKELGDSGSSSIRIAVIDTGFDIEHPALAGNGRKIVLPFNAGDNNTDVSPVSFDGDGNGYVAAHGTSCAAVAAGAIDDEGVFGASPNSKIMPIKLNILSDTAIIRAFSHAMNNGADIISCSLGWPTPVPLSTQVSNFLKKVSREGRGGKGIPVLFAAGNANPNSNNQPRAVSDFAAHPDCICVVASNSLDEHSDYSFYGANAWISAPTNGNQGVGITTASADWDGSQVVHNYTSGFGGTSSATPLAAGCVAILLAANPNLTAGQVKEILKKSTDKIGSASDYDVNGHSKLLGYGRINTLKALKMAMPGAATTTSAPSPTRQKGRVKSKFLNVRTGPGTHFTKVGELATNDVVELFEKADAWFRIGDGRWVKGDFLEIIQPPKQGKVISADALNVRGGADVTFPKVGTLKTGSIVSIFETAANGWLRIGDGRWVSGRFVQVL